MERFLKKVAPAPRKIWYIPPEPLQLYVTLPAFAMISGSVMLWEKLYPSED